MDIHLHIGKAATPPNRAPKGLTTPTVSIALMVDLSKVNIHSRARIFEVAMRAIVVTTIKIQIADSPARGPLQTRIMLPLPPGGEEATSKTFSGLRAMQVLTVEAVVNTVSSLHQGICNPPLTRNQPRINRAKTIILFDLQRIYKLKIRARKTRRCHRLQDRNPNLRRNKNPNSVSLSRLNLQTLHPLSQQRILHKR